MRAADKAIAYEHPRLAVTAVISDQSVAARLDRAIQRTRIAVGRTKIIEAKPNDEGSKREHPPEELRTPPIRRRI